MSRPKAEGYVSDKSEPYYPVIIVTCPVCNYDTKEKRHSIKKTMPFACSYCGVLFEVRKWTDGEVGE